MRTSPTQPISIMSANMQCAEEGLRRQVLAYTERVMLIRHVLKAGWSGTRHSHPHEQLVYVLNGRLRFTTGTETFEAATGDSFVVPGGVEHQALALEDSEVLDVFAPYREDYSARMDENS